MRSQFIIDKTLPYQSSIKLTAKAQRALVVDEASRLARMILALYAFVYYIFPGILTFLFGAPLNLVLIASPNYLLGFILAILVTGLIYWLLPRVKPPRLGALYPAARLLFDERVILGASLAFLYVAYQFWENLGLSYRQTGSRISETGVVVIVLYIFQNYLIAALVVLLGRDARELKSAKLPLTFALLATVLGFFLSLQASSNVIVMAVAGLILLRLVSNKQFLRAAEGRSSIPNYVIIGLVAIFALFVGVANKRGVDETLFLAYNNLPELIGIFQTRLSYHLYSASFLADYHFTDTQLGLTALSEVLANISHRIDVIIGNPTVFNEIGSVKRLNYELIAYYFRERTGTAPGMIGGIFYVPYGIFVLPITIFVYVVILKLISVTVNNSRISLFEIAFLTMFFGGIIDASIDLINVFDIPFTKLFFLIFAASIAQRRIEDSNLQSVRNLQAVMRS